MAKLTGYISSDYINAANKLRGKAARRRIVAYVESYDDVLFWRMVLSQYENETRYFEVMLPSRNSLNKGKRQALVSLMRRGGGGNMIACVDADYDYLLQGSTPQSEFLLSNPYVVHTYAYAIENHQCYAPSLHNVCVMTTLNDHAIFDFEAYLTEYSRAIFPLFVWSVMLYKRNDYARFTISDFNRTVSIKHSRFQEMMENVKRVGNKARVRVHELQRTYKGLKEEYLQTKARLTELGVTQDNAYLYIQGHHLFDDIVAPTVQSVCEELRREREREIRKKSRHTIQLHNELSAYNNSLSETQAMLKKNMGYVTSPQYRQMLDRVEAMLSKVDAAPGNQENAKTTEAEKPSETNT